MQLVRRNAKIRREQAGHLDQKPIGQSAFFLQKENLQESDRIDKRFDVHSSQTIKRAATIQGDEAMLHLLLGVNDDLMAAEAKYHKNCYSLYTAKKVRDDKGESSNELHHENAFKQLVEELRPGLEQGRAYDMVSLLIK